MEKRIEQTFASQIWQPRIPVSAVFIFHSFVPRCTRIHVFKNFSPPNKSKRRVSQSITVGGTANLNKKSLPPSLLFLSILVVSSKRISQWKVSLLIFVPFPGQRVCTRTFQKFGELFNRANAAKIWFPINNSDVISTFSLPHLSLPDRYPPARPGRAHF